MNGLIQQSPSLVLRVSNSNQLESGCEVSHRFTQEGGRVGCGEYCSWKIQDVGHSVADEHFFITWRDGAFCLRGASQPLKLNRAAVDGQLGYIRLQHGDELTLGSLTLKTLISLTGGEIHDPLQVSPESLVTHYSNPLEAMLEGTTPDMQRESSAAVLEPTVANAWSNDPLNVLQSESLTLPGSETGDVTTVNHALQHNLYRNALPTSPLSDNAKDSAMDQDFIELPQISQFITQQNDDEPSPADISQRHVALTPLMRGLNAPLAMHDSQQANDFIEEVGKTLQATLKGLLALQQQQDGLSDKHLRPLEDNPLRLGLDYDTTLNVLFAEGKSLVHLSAPEAVGESLRNLRLHHQANQSAITEALVVMLEAFSPQRLMARFAQYRRSSERNEMDPAWAWDMYCNYYQELASSRQQGFEKLFNEVYEQAYDRALRQGQREMQE
ncbi:type VI secretion system-associated FHA domain protein TagH [Edaphovirga cremea]|uniref:type VI secretion system-associated FHA domain protein TagH n=1 Tax=Edaphovirga cremea TaxID=2267246 RepID=UPI000DEFD887|nr:type VI secretion system-associated FHA domain protein TagH [Edaphovirga cremea]